MSQSPFNFGSASGSSGGEHDPFAPQPVSPMPDPFDTPAPPPGAPPPGDGGNDPTAPMPFQGQMPPAEQGDIETTSPQPFQTAGGGFDAQPEGAFGAPGGGSPTLTLSRPPVFLLFIALAIAVVAAIVAGIFSQPVLAIVCWVLAGPVAIGVLAFFVMRDNAARSVGVYSSPGWVRPFHIATSVVCFVAVIVPAVRIALWVGRL